MALTVNGVLIPEEKIAGEMARLRDSYEKYVRENGGAPSEKELREWAEEDLIEAELFRAEALASEPVPSDERARQNIKEFPEIYEKLPEDERWARSREDLRLHAFEKEIRKRVAQPSEADLKRCYEEKPEVFQSSEVLRLSHVCRFVGVGGVSRADAYLELLHVKSELVAGRLGWGDALETLSDTYSEDYGIFPAIRRGDLPGEIEDKLFALAPDEISDAIEWSGDSVHLFRLLMKESPRKLAFKEVREQLSDILFERAFQEEMDTVFDALKAKAVILR